MVSGDGLAKPMPPALELLGDKAALLALSPQSGNQLSKLNSPCGEHTGWWWDALNQAWC